MMLKVFLGLLLLVILIALAFWWTRRRGRTRPVPAAAPASATWAPPRYAVAETRPTGPSLQVSLNALQAQGEQLFVSWTAVIDGNVLVQVHWAAPQILVEQDGSVVISYTRGETGDLALPELRTCRPGEIVARSVKLAREALGGAIGGRQVTVAVEYGAAEDFAAASADAEGYAAWRRLAISAPRVAPRCDPPCCPRSSIRFMRWCGKSRAAGWRATVRSRRCWAIPGPRAPSAGR